MKKRDYITAKDRFNQAFEILDQKEVEIEDHLLSSINEMFGFFTQDFTKPTYLNYQSS